MSQGSLWRDKVVIVTGGGSGIGRDVCLALAHEGARVVIGNRTAQTGQAVLEKIDRKSVV